MKIIDQILLYGNNGLILIMWLLIKLGFALLALLYYCYTVELV